MFAECRFSQYRLCGLVAETDRRPDMAPPAFVATDHAALDQHRMRKGFWQRVDAAIADINVREVMLPFGQRLLAELRGEKIDHRLLVRSRTPKAQLSKPGATEEAEEIVDEFRLLPGEHEMPSILRLVGTVER